MVGVVLTNLLLTPADPRVTNNRQQTTDNNGKFQEERKIDRAIMDSQCDMFEDQPPRIETEKSASLPCYLYKGVILFQWNIKENTSRFKAFDRELFPEIKENWIQCQLKPNSRLKKLNNLTEDGDVFSLFSKVESGKNNFVVLKLAEFYSLARRIIAR